MQRSLPNVQIAVVLSMLLTGAAGAKDLFVAQRDAAANDQNPGTEAQPFKTIQAGVNAAQPGGDWGRS
jgi:hypothetical protein